MKKIIYLVAAFTMLTFVACDKNDTEIIVNDISNVEMIESDLISNKSEPIYSKTIRLYSKDGEYVDIVLSSDNKNIIDDYLHLYEDYVINNDEKNVAFDGAIGTPIEFSNADMITLNESLISNIPTISYEVIGSSKNLKDYTIARKKLTQQLGSEKMKVTAYPYIMAFEFKSAARNGYAKLKILPIPSYYSMRITWFRPGYVDCWLCLWQTTSDFMDFNHNAEISSIINNPWSLDGMWAPSSRKYKLGFGVYSSSPDNLQFRYSTNPIPNW